VSIALFDLRAKHPREQGLKLITRNFSNILSSGTSSETSTRTRIETCLRSPRESGFPLRAKHPREQGLKPTYPPHKSSPSFALRAKHPREQGLKLKISGTSHSCRSLRAKHPREQGLKHRLQAGKTRVTSDFERNIHENKD